MTVGWDRVATRAAWTLLLLFTGLSSVLNARSVTVAGPATGEQLAFHAAIPVVVLVAAMYAELFALSSAYRAAKAVVVIGLVVTFCIAVAASYVAILAVVSTWNPHTPVWISIGVAAIPDVMMIMAGTGLLALRMRRHRAGTTARNPQAGRLRRLADAATARAEAALAVSTNTAADPSADPSDDPAADVTETVTDTAVDTPAKPTRAVRKPAARTPAKPAADPALEPFMDVAERLADAKLIRGKTAVDYAKILRALDSGWSPSRIRGQLGYSHDTTHKVSEAVADAPALVVVGGPR